MIYVFTYLADQLFNLISGFGASGIVLSLLIIAAPIQLRRLYLERRIAPFNLPGVWFFCVLTGWSIVAAAWFGKCGLSPKGAASLALAWLIFLAWKALDLTRIAISRNISLAILMVGGASLIAQYFGFGILSQFWVFNKPSGLFNEPSHVAMYLLPLIFYRLLKSYKDPAAICLIGIILLLANSATFVVGIGLLCLVMYARALIVSPRRILLGLLALGLILAGIFMVEVGLLNVSIISERVHAIILAASRDDPSGIMNASAIVWLNGWSQAYDSIILTSGLGVGLNQMGCGDFYWVGRFSNHISLWTGGLVLNWNDGSFLASKLISELGILGIVIVAWLTFRSSKAIIAYIFDASRELNASKTVLVANAAGATAILLLLFIRANGYFLMPVLLDVSLLLYAAKNSKD